MSALPYIGLAIVALAAVGFVAWPLLRERRGPGKKAVWLLAGAVALFVLGIGAGTNLVLGRPHLPARSAMGLKTD